MTAPPDLTGRPTPWVETPAGGLFFVNAVLAAPALVVLFPLAVGALLRGVGAVAGPSPFLDTVPAVAAHFAPRVGWLAAVPAWLALRNLALADRPWARAGLVFFLLLHLATLGYVVWRWAG